MAFPIITITQLGPQIRDPDLRAIFAPGEPGPSDSAPRPVAIDEAFQAELLVACAPILVRAEQEILQ
ncbi:hypothetical protein [Azospirillum aestuarii]|uniref:hypothetical protein n=1 Tax=Azospirillum aestuarii TaxID=2802052 RepID=UPI004054D91F